VRHCGAQGLDGPSGRLARKRALGIGGGGPELGRQHDAQEPLLERRDRLGPRGTRAPRAFVQPARHHFGERLGHGRTVGRSVGGVLGEHAPHEIVERGGDLGVELSWVRHLREQHLGEDRHELVALERGQTGQTLEEHAAQGEHVRADVDVALGARLLGGHVAGRADDHPGARDRPHPPTQMGQAEVEEPRIVDAPTRQEDVARLDVAVRHAPGVRCGERGGDPRGDLDGLGHRQALPLDPRGQGLALEPLGGQVAEPGRVHAVGDVAHDPRMLQLGQRPRLSREPLVAGDAALVHDLEGDVAPLEAIERTVDGPHPSLPGETLDLEAGSDDVAGSHPRTVTRSPAPPRRRRLWPRSGGPRRPPHRDV
jgi:hypothetical protein